MPELKVDQLGRTLHGIGFVYDREIAEGLMAVLLEGGAGVEVAEASREMAVENAVRQLLQITALAESGGPAP